MMKNNILFMYIVLFLLGVSAGLVMSAWSYSRGYSDGQDIVMKNVEYVCSNRFGLIP